jgi:membrane protease YdiL (CAAX protease family)
LSFFIDRVRWTYRELSSPKLPYFVNIVFVVSGVMLLGWVLAYVTWGVAEYFDYGFEKEAVTAQRIRSWPLISVIFVVPLVETFLLAGVIGVMHRLRRNSLQTAIICGLVFGVLHAWSNGLAAFIAPGWAFFVFAMAYQAWRARSFPHAFWAALIPHSINNALALYIE